MSDDQDIPPLDVDIEPYEPEDVDLTDPDLYLNRELSELAFQRRVLREVLDDRTPLLERIRFLSIVTRNLDEFVMKRVGGLKQQIEAGVTETTVDGRTPLEQWEEIHEQLEPMLRKQADCYETELRPALARAGIEIVAYDDLGAGARSGLREHFERSIKPTLTPLSFDPAHPFPFISNRSLSLAVLTRPHGGDDPTFTRIKIPPNRPRLIEVGESSRYVLVEELIEHNLDLLLPNVDILDTALFRLTRNAEVRRNEEVAEDLIEMIEDVLEQRRFASAVRMEIESDANPHIRETLREELDLDEREIYDLEGPIDYRDFASLAELDRPELKPDPWSPQSHPRLREDARPAFEADEGDGESRSVFEHIDEDDILLHHPYHDFGETVQRFLTEAANDPDVLAVKAAIYRTASDSQVIQSLIEAAENGKQVAVMVELKARFDEQNNLEWVRRLEENGIHVAYGTIGLKTHTKTALVVREDDDNDVTLYSHVGTGNYHSETAKGYVDLGLLTADRDIGQDLVTLFNSFTGPGLDEQFRKLLVAPVTMREEFTRYIRREARHARAGRPARIVAKVNGLEDPGIVAELYRASMAGVDIDLIVRDICRLRPGVEGISETVSIHSVVGRFLEHSRIFYFENGARAADADDGAASDPEGADVDWGHPEYYLGSADWMARNLDSRVEAVTPVEDPDIRRQLKFNLELILADNRRRWTMNPDGSYDQQRPEDGERVVDTQAVLMERTRTAVTNEAHDTAPGAASVPESDILVATADGDAERPTGSDHGRPSGVPKEAAPPGPTDPSGEPPDGATLPEGPLARHRDRWYRPDSGTYRFAVRTPDGDRRYLKTRSGAEAALRRLYDVDDADSAGGTGDADGADDNANEADGDATETADADDMGDTGDADTGN
ncbi:polyphosphate kinase [Natronomonas moolapensis 8.8.11]|uniref:Polyphosphate kinase n=1 Tax=Natronomonas moolapensis (strain DSM 18674 / CECT 7526 / JCM 14361 / 8.8.11) TaxID=268739 RepID=M1XTP2_NATM8|nr:polyphosphate kinase 1 [Natronomonas moolapensis]CCQ37859.1 polyphosphate kinase [Natronomonas moolapensis 8.8.11]